MTSNKGTHPEIVEARIHFRGGTLFWLKFDNGIHRLVDLLPIIRNGPAFQDLLADGNKKLAEFTVESGTLTWKDGTVDIAPERLWSERDIRSNQYIWMR